MVIRVLPSPVEDTRHIFECFKVGSRLKIITVLKRIFQLLIHYLPLFGGDSVKDNRLNQDESSRQGSQ